jgi:DEAD/DEAH box helicase domain-containing protein
MNSKSSETAEIDQIIDLFGSGNLAQLVTCSWIKEAQAATFSGYPAGLNTTLSEIIEKNYPNGLFKHQVEAIQAVQAGKNVLITTGTSSGKSLCYQLPLLNAAIRDSSATALLLFPTKALAEDQLKKLVEMVGLLENVGSLNVPAGTYDGDTPQGKRIAIRNKYRILLTNPDMLHIGILPHHTHWERFLKNLKFVVIDEVHTYRGVFGSHFANVLRRLKRILNFYGSHPCFILTSATISNATEFATKLTGEPFEIFATDTSYQESRRYFFVNPPVVDESLGLRKGLVDQTIEIASYALSHQVQSILFSRTRKTVEVTLKRLRETFGRSDKELHGYRSGYLPRERRLIENGLRSGKIRSVISTSALEMGIDMGKVDLTLLMGYPGSIASFYQQSGRAGRRDRNSASILIASASPMDQYVIRHCDFVSKGSPEHALIDPDNPLILLEHLKCAAFELPFSSQEIYGDLSGEDLIGYLKALVLLKHLLERNNFFYWIAEDYPSAKISLRNISGNPITLRLRAGLESQLIGEVDFQSALRMAHPGAVYMHDGNQYYVDELDLKDHIAWLSTHNEPYFTEHRSDMKISVEQIIHKDKKANLIKSLGEIVVTENVTGFKRVDWDTLMTLGVFDLEGLPENALHTKGIWLTIPEDAVDALRKENKWLNDKNNYGSQWQDIRVSILQRDAYRCQACGIHLPEAQLHVHHKIPFRTFGDIRTANHPSNLITLCPSCHRRAEQNVRVRSGLSGVTYLMANLTPLTLLCDHRDIGSFSEAESEITGGRPVIALYDQFPGGIGLSAKLYEVIEDVLKQSLEVIDQCGCEDGCPSCVGPAGENGLGGKEFAREILKTILTTNE